jgi:hypothetical protein
MNRNLLLLIFLLATLVCAYDIYAALHRAPLSWVLAALMAAISLVALRKLVRQDYSNTWW